MAPSASRQKRLASKAAKSAKAKGATDASTTAGTSTPIGLRERFVGEHPPHEHLGGDEP